MPDIPDRPNRDFVQPPGTVVFADGTVKTHEQIKSEAEAARLKQEREWREAYERQKQEEAASFAALQNKVAAWKVSSVELVGDAYSHRLKIILESGQEVLVEGVDDDLLYINDK